MASKLVRQVERRLIQVHTHTHVHVYSSQVKLGTVMWLIPCCSDWWTHTQERSAPQCEECACFVIPLQCLDPLCANKWSHISVIRLLIYNQML